MVDLSIVILWPVRGEATFAPEGLVPRGGEPRAGPVSSTPSLSGKGALLRLEIGTGWVYPKGADLGREGFEITGERNKGNCFTEASNEDPGP